MGDLIKKLNKEEKHEIKKEDNGYIKFLLEEYRYFGDWFKRSEETGEKRLNFFITLVTAVIAVTMTFITSATEFPDILSIYTPIIISLLLLLLVLGILTFGRIIKRNKDSDGYKKDIDHIRSFFKVKYKALQDYESYYEIKGRKILTGGVADVIISINSILFAIIVFFLTFAFTILIRIFLFILSFFGIFFFSQYIALIQYYKKYFELKGIIKSTKLLSKKYITFSLSGVLLVLIMVFIILWFFYYATSNIAIFFEFSAITLICLSSTIWIIGFWNLKKRYYSLTERREQVKKNWEWRIFFKDNFNLLNKLAENNQMRKSIIEKEPISKFHDYYINLDNSKYGLKERIVEKNGEFSSPKLELKILIKTRDKAGLWAKILSTELSKSLEKDKGLNKTQLNQVLQKELIRSSSKNSKYIKKVLSQLKEKKSDLKRICIEKKRTRIRGVYYKKNDIWVFYQSNDILNAPLENPNAILIEQTEIQIHSKKDLKLNRSICLETKKRRIIEEFCDKFIENLKNNIMSYPKFIENQKPFKE